MDALTHLAQGFGVLLQLKYLGFCLAGVLVGQIIGALPGIGPSAAIAILLPLTFGGDATGSIIMFAGIYYGAQYGGTFTSVLVSIPGESSTVMTSLDGYQMARNGRAGAALGMAAIASFFAGTVGTLGLDAAGAAARRGCAVLRAARVFRAGPRRPHLAVAGRRRPGEGPDDGARRLDDRHDRRRSAGREHAVHVRPAVADGRHRFPRACGGAVRCRRSAGERRAGAGTAQGRAHDPQADADVCATGSRAAGPSCAAR